MMRACKRASAIVSLSEDMGAKFRVLCDRLGGPAGSSLAAKVSVIPQSVVDEPDDGREKEREVEGEEKQAGDADIRGRLGLAPGSFLVLLVAGLRPVKAPTYVFDAFVSWRRRDPGLCPSLVVVGPPLDPAVTEEVRRRTGARADDEADQTGAHVGTESSRSLSRMELSPAGVGTLRYGGVDGLFYHPAVPRPRLLTYMRQADALLNTSVSEGQCNAILEAMMLGTPVIARRNAGNASLVRPGETGLLFDTPAEAVGALEELAKRGAEAAALRERLTRAAKDYVEKNHSHVVEAEAWLNVLERARSGRDVSGRA
jgi:glycosyltransferase involved in cell wall biosynthesis